MSSRRCSPPSPVVGVDAADAPWRLHHYDAKAERASLLDHGMPWLNDKRPLIKLTSEGHGVESMESLDFVSRYLGGGACSGTSTGRRMRAFIDQPLGHITTPHQ